MQTHEVDVLVLGGGMSGLAAASFAAHAGARVCVCEKLDKVGGSSVYSAGMFWAPKTYESIRRWVPDGDPILQKAFHSDYLCAVEWMRRSGIPVSPRFGPIMTIGIGYPVKLPPLYGFHQRRIAQSGTNSEIWLSTSVVSLIQEHPGVAGSRITGAIVQRNTAGRSEYIRIQAKSTILATGGFQGSSRLTSLHLGADADDIFVRSNPGSVGEGLLLSEGVGAGTSNGLSTYYGHLMASPVHARDVDGKDYIPLAQYQSKHCLLVNTSGKRFADETLGDEVINQELAKQKDRKGFLLFNENVRAQHCVTAMFPNAGAIDRLAKAREYNCRVASASTVQELLKKVSAWGCNGPQLRHTVDNYRRTIRDGDRTVILDAPVGGGGSARPEPLVDGEGPFWAMEVQPSITFTYGGISIDDQAHALTPSGKIIPGLLVSGVDGGGFSNRQYCGGLALAFVTGYWAARTAAKELGLRVEDLPQPSKQDLQLDQNLAHL